MLILTEVIKVPRTNLVSCFRYFAQEAAEKSIFRVCLHCLRCLHCDYGMASCCTRKLYSFHFVLPVYQICGLALSIDSLSTVAFFVDGKSNDRESSICRTRWSSLTLLREGRERRVRKQHTCHSGRHLRRGKRDWEPPTQAL